MAKGRSLVRGVSKLCFLCDLLFNRLHSNEFEHQDRKENEEEGKGGCELGGEEIKIRNSCQSEGKSSFRIYRDMYYGKTSLGFVLKAELIQAMFGSMPGGAGLFLRSKCYRSLFEKAGRKVFIGRNVTLRHTKKIRLGNNVIIDDNCVIDAKGVDNKGIDIGDNVFIGRNSLVYCKNGNIRFEKNVNISVNCTVVSSNDLTIGDGTLVGGYSYLLSGGEYDFDDKETEFADQSGMLTKGPLAIGRNCWLGARVTVLDGTNIGERCVIGAGALVTKEIPANSLAVGIPARVVKSI